MTGKYQKYPTSLYVFSLLVLFILAAPMARAQDWVRTGTNLGVQRIRIAAADFKLASGDPQAVPLRATFNTVLFSDLKNAGVFDMVAKSMAPEATPGGPQEINLAQWAAAPASAQMVVFGSFSVDGGRINVRGFVFDTHNTESPQILGKQYSDNANDENARQIAHRFADEIITQLGGGINGICETKIYFVARSGDGNKEIWAMDYDGAAPHAVTHLGSISLSPRVSPDNTRVAFSSLGRNGWTIKMYSLVLNRMVNFNAPGGTTLSPAWSSDGSKVAYSSSISGDPEIYTADASGGGAHRITAFRGPDVSPTWNPKSNSQIAWVSGRTGLPQIYIMDSDGANVMRMTDGGYATSPSWSPNGQFLAFAWNRKYGPGAPGGQDIYIMDIASKRWTQLTHDAGRNDFPSWSPDGRHIVFQREDESGTQIWSMLADGTEQQQLTHRGSNSMPNWSWK
ncbi:Tol-Pal system beta propeller repeat protein TolB [Silvibacterium dinghuense]|uniref:Tol-Pal system beta propeller repeat protein TolB n=1 Tax=Silvibacterium dinghuense TaxID=1560006 RepID=A0A4Q1SEP8_9BACT|nr:Tol-Pal system beta propeller repeat protein TolB [Silvibacterium dinghuense]RXS95408.1 Tol-Pal system beta propeller repeat protein TolB [Silvibacterium dinghuense]GGH12981.1 protein TolB [Silvibacterium dinghuense]